MMPFSSYSYPNYNRYSNYYTPQTFNNTSSSVDNSSKTRDSLNRHSIDTRNKTTTCKEIKIKEDNPMFEILGIKLYFDDILIVCLLLFLYEEGADDPWLFICLVLLLLS